MVLTKQDFFIKAGLLVAAVAVSSVHWSIAMNPDGEALFHLGYLLAFVILVPIIAIIPGALFFGVAALAMNQRTRDHTRACFLVGLYIVALLMVCFNVFNVTKIHGKNGIEFYWYIPYVMAFIYSLPGVRFTPTRNGDEREGKTKAEDRRLEPMTAGELTKIGRYDLTRILSKGATGIVYEGMDSKLHRKVALKAMLKSTLNLDSTEEFTMRFMHEAQAVARLNHPNIVQAYDFGEQGDIAYIVTEFINGKDLKRFFDANERFALKEVVRNMCELCDALDYAHEAGIIHRDVKPAHVMIDGQARAKLTGFGVARIIDAGRNEHERAGTMVGTPAYMSPEQITGGTIDRRTDVFSVGIILYQFLTGEKPFTGSDARTIAKKIIQDHPPAPSSINKTISPLFDAVINKALAKSADARYQTARDLGVGLKNALIGKSEEDGRTRAQGTRSSSSNSRNTGGGHTPNWAQYDRYFRILEIQPGATINEVKAAYRRQMQQYHPDKVASLGKELRDLAEAKSKEIDEAYRAIVDALDAL